MHDTYKEREITTDFDRSKLNLLHHCQLIASLRRQKMAKNKSAKGNTQGYVPDRYVRDEMSVNGTFANEISAHQMSAYLHHSVWYSDSNIVDTHVQRSGFRLHFYFCRDDMYTHFSCVNTWQPLSLSAARSGTWSICHQVDCQCTWPTTRSRHQTQHYVCLRNPIITYYMFATWNLSGPGRWPLCCCNR